MLGTARVAAIGPATAAALEAVGIVPDLVPAESNSEGMAAALIPTMRRGRVLVVRAESGRDVMRRLLSAEGHDVTEVAAYATVPRERLDDADRRVLHAHPVDWVTITSGSIAESAVRLFGDRMGSWKVASISPVTSRVLEGLGFPPDCEAETPTAQSLVAAIAAAESRFGARSPRDPSRA
jgi:uroporphyrinogen-III synthase